MKKLAIMMIAMVGFIFAANAQQARANVPGDNSNTVLVSVSSDSQTSATLTIYNNSTKDITVSVSVLNDQRSEVGTGSYSVPGATAQGNSAKTTVTISKVTGCRAATSGCEVKDIKITNIKVN